MKKNFKNMTGKVPSFVLTEVWFILASVVAGFVITLATKVVCGWIGVPVQKNPLSAFVTVVVLCIFMAENVRDARNFYWYSWDRFTIPLAVVFCFGGSVFGWWLATLVFH